MNKKNPIRKSGKKLKNQLNDIEIKQWITLTTSHYGSVFDIISSDEKSWIYMPIICITLERLGSLPYDIISVPLQEKMFWEQFFLSEILYLEDRFKENSKEPEIRLKSSSLYLNTPQRKIMDFVMNKEYWTSINRLKEDIQLLVLGVDLARKLDPKILQISNVINNTNDYRTQPPMMKHNTRTPPYSV
tara:strand:- start:1321 stop:1884 length:564 start_codon:yes stop_codon:yes gene_type:complete